MKKCFQIVALTLLAEFVTVFFRFVMGLKSSEATASTVGKLTGGIRVHHGYVGLFFLLLNFFGLKLKKTMELGLILFMSDVMHHALLYFFTGNAEFDIFYSDGSRQ